MTEQIESVDQRTVGAIYGIRTYQDLMDVYVENLGISKLEAIRTIRNAFNDPRAK